PGLIGARCNLLSLTERCAQLWDAPMTPCFVSNTFGEPVPVSTPQRVRCVTARDKLCNYVLAYATVSDERLCKVTLTSLNACAMGACGLWTVTVAAVTRLSARQTSRSRAARVSIRFTGSPAITAASCEANSP